MFKRLLERAAARASLVNIGFDADRLARAFPGDSSHASVHMFKLLENVLLAVSNGASEEQIMKVLDPSITRNTPDYAVIVRSIVKLAVCKEEEQKVALDKQIIDTFRAATGTSPDPSNLPRLARKALKREYLG